MGNTLIFTIMQGTNHSSSLDNWLTHAKLWPWAGLRFWAYVAYKHPGTLNIALCHLSLCTHVLVFGAQREVNKYFFCVFTVSYFSWICEELMYSPKFTSNNMFFYWLWCQHRYSTSIMQMCSAIKVFCIRDILMLFQVGNYEVWHIIVFMIWCGLCNSGVVLLWAWLFHMLPSLARTPDDMRWECKICWGKLVRYYGNGP